MLNPIRRLTSWWKQQKEEQAEIAQHVQRWSDEVEAEILPLSIDEAQSRAGALLADPARFRCETRPPTAEEQLNLQPLAPRLRGLLEQYAMVQPAEIPVGTLEDYLDRDFLGEAEEYGLGQTPFLLIGVENAGHCQLVVKPGEEPVYYLDDPPNPAQPNQVYPSVYHYLLARDRASALLHSADEETR